MTDQYTAKEREYIERFYHAFEEFQNSPYQSLGSLVEKHVNNIPDRIALYFEDITLTWEQFNKECNKYANFFLEYGVKKQETVALILENAPEFLFLTTGLNKIQVINALININQRKQALTHAIKIVEPRCIVIDGSFISHLNDVIGELDYNKENIFVNNNTNEIPHDYVNLTEILHSKSENNPKTTLESTIEDFAFNVYTSGTTGLPKAVKWKNASIRAGIGYLHALSHLTHEDVVYITTPLYHSLGGGTIWFGIVYTGAACVLRKKFSASQFWVDINRYNITYTAMVGEIPRYLLNRPKSEFIHNRTLKKVLTLGLKKDSWYEFKNRFEIDHIFECYGSTEGYGPLVNVDENPGMVGRINLETNAIAKVDTDSGEFLKNSTGFLIKCKPGDIGMLMNKIQEAENFDLYKSYEETRKKVIVDAFEKGDAYLVTGDVFQIHEDRWLSFADRLGDTFRWKGENVSAQEVENILNSHPLIETSAVYGISIPNAGGKAGMASIKIKSDSSFNRYEFDESIIKHINESLPSYAIPVIIRIRKEFEFTGSYKVIKTNLRKEGYNIEIVKDPLFFRDSKTKTYIPMNKDLYQQITKFDYKNRK
ncbi:MAG: AMP-binding protein [Promethearchaeota archaeon]